MGNLILMLAFMVGLIAGPIVVARLFPTRSTIQGNVIAGQSGVSTVFWGASLGLAVGYLVLALLIISDPIGGPLLIRFQLAGGPFAMLGLVLAPMVVCGFHKWRWDSEGIEFNGAFRRRRIRWSDIAVVRRTPDRGWLYRTADGVSVRTSNYTVGLGVIAASLARYRPDLAPVSA